MCYELSNRQGCNDIKQCGYSPNSLKLGRNRPQCFDYSTGIEEARSKRQSGDMLTSGPTAKTHSRFWWCSWCSSAMNLFVIITSFNLLSQHLFYYTEMEWWGGGGATKCIGSPRLVSTTAIHGTRSFTHRPNTLTMYYRRVNISYGYTIRTLVWEYKQWNRSSLAMHY